LHWVNYWPLPTTKLNEMIRDFPEYENEIQENKLFIQILQFYTAILYLTYITEWDKKELL